MVKKLCEHLLFFCNLCNIKVNKISREYFRAIKSVSSRPHLSWYPRTSFRQSFYPKCTVGSRQFASIMHFDRKTRYILLSCNCSKLMFTFERFLQFQNCKNQKIRRKLATFEPHFFYNCFYSSPSGKTRSIFLIFISRFLIWHQGW